MGKPILLITTAAVCLTSVHALSQEPAKSTRDEPIVTTIQMREMAWNDFKEADKQLNKVYKKLLSQLESSAQKEKLRATQRAWLIYRDKNADFEASFYEGGSIRPQILTGTMTAMTQKRTKELQAILDNEAAD